jgi:hypothetical protein
MVSLSRCRGITGNPGNGGELCRVYVIGVGTVNGLEARRYVVLVA